MGDLLAQDLVKHMYAPITASLTPLRWLSEASVGVGGNSFLTLMKEVRNKGIGVKFLKEDLEDAALLLQTQLCSVRSPLLDKSSLSCCVTGEGKLGVM